LFQIEPVPAVPPAAGSDFSSPTEIWFRASHLQVFIGPSRSHKNGLIIMRPEGYECPCAQGGKYPHIMTNREMPTQPFNTHKI
jgi:hypothetical protein